MRGKKNQSPPQSPRDYSVNALAKLLKKDRRTLDKVVVDLQPVRVSGKTKYFRLEDVEAALKRYSGNKKRDEKLDEEIRRLRRENDEADILLVKKAEVIESIRRCMTPAVALLEQRLVNEYPTAVAGLDVPQARVYGRRVCDEIITYFQTLADEWILKAPKVATN